MSWQLIHSLNIATYNTYKLNTLFCEHKITRSENYKCEDVTLMCESLLQTFNKYVAGACVLNSLYLSFLVYKMRIMIVTTL